MKLILRSVLRVLALVLVYQILQKSVSTKPTARLSQYARIFDSGNKTWYRDPEMNAYFIKMQERYANDILKSRGNLFLNEVYDMLGFPRSREGAIVGWLSSESMDEGFVSFDIGEPIEGEPGALLIDFNV